MEKESEIRLNTEIKEVVTPVVGLRLQDVILRTETCEPKMLELRQKILVELNSNPSNSERLIVLSMISSELLGLSLDEAKNEAQRVLVPYHSNGDYRKTLIISSASSASASQETECGILEARGHVIDIPGAIEGRDTRSAQAGDIALISTEAGLMMARAKGSVEIINLADEVILAQTSNKSLRGRDIYYKSDGLLLLMLTNPESLVISQILDELVSNPLIYPYNLDEETQIALLCLAKKAGLSRLDINANSPEVAVELTRKGYKYPKIEDALQIPHQDNPYVMQREEWKLSQAAIEIDHHPDSVPGYVITESADDEEMYRNSLAACMLLSTRYHLETGWIKPDRGTDGGNQGPVEIGVDNITRKMITDYLECGAISNALELYKSKLPDLSPVVTQKLNELHKKGGSWVIEAKTDYFTINFNIAGQDHKLATTPSVHIIKGEPQQTISLQLVDGVAWGGNLICSEDTWNQLVDMVDTSDSRILDNPTLTSCLKESYHLMTAAMKNYVDAVNSSEKYRGGQVRGGADLAICTLGGKFGDNKLMVALQDYNARANGGETAYTLYDEAQKVYSNEGQAVTRIITPKINFDVFSNILPGVIQAVNQTHNRNISSEQVKLIAVSAGWGQMGMIGTNALDITKDVYLIEEQLRSRGLVQ